LHQLWRWGLRTGAKSTLFVLVLEPLDTILFAATNNWTIYVYYE
jgi:hypothetical protein